MDIYTSAFKLPEVFQFDNYVKAITSGNILRAIGNSFFLAGTSVVVIIVVASLAAFVIARNSGKIYSLIYIYFICGILIPIHSTFIPLVRMVGSIKGQNNYLVMIAIYVTFNLPIGVFIITGYMKSISRELEEAAIIDGCSIFGIYSRIYLPLAQPAIATVAILTFLAVYNDLIFAVLFITKKDLRTITLALNSFSGEYTLELGPIFAAIVLGILPMFIIYIFLKDRIISGISAGAVKG